MSNEMNNELEQEAPVQKKPGVAKEVIGIIVVFILMLLLNILVSTVLVLAEVEVPLVIFGTITEVVVVLPAIIYTRMKKERVIESFGFRKIKLSTIPWTVLLTIVSAPLLWCANSLSQVFVPNTVVAASDQFTSGSLLASYIVVAIVAPVCEESAMRGFCFNRFRRVTSLAVAAAVSGIMFGILHLNINQMCYAIVLGVIFALANFASGSIWTSIIMHFIFNSFGFLALAAAQAAAELSGTDIAQQAEVARTESNVMLIAGLVLLVISVGLSFIIRKVLRRIAMNENNQEAVEVFSKKKNKEAVAE
ncbi:CPBP family intramembrane glutamic endopeptidase [Butyrivibrio sp. FCS014]|uniref:CPBP family intramembrane glutamic endopeptidase n=1 Tax=Butyrivibrio sp. FCS014 TaxID=1408304 RepID=UPI000463CCF3|nr:type II CAAX endopeptidase family protein [Butyrivibrio sp. FCS014]